MEWIKTFFLNIWQWFTENKDGITAFFMSGQAISFVAAIVMLIRNLKGMKTNTSSTDALNQTLVNTNTMSDSVELLKSNFIALKSENDKLRSELKTTETLLEESNKELKDKLNAILEVQSIVYSTVRDDSVRQTVNTILNNARYSEKNFKEELQSQIDDLQIKLSNEVNAMTNKITESVSKVKTIMDAEENAKNTLHKKSENIRY